MTTSKKSGSSRQKNGIELRSKGTAKSYVPLAILSKLEKQQADEQRLIELLRAMQMSRKRKNQ